MSGLEEIDFALNILGVGNRNISILHCLSQYPAEYSRLNLLSIKKLQEMYGDKCTIGYSDHSIGVHIALSAVVMGARVIEKHVTLDKNMKGTDHKGAVEPQEMKVLVHNIRTFEKSVGEMSVFKDDSVEESAIKLERSLATKKDIQSGDIFTIDNVYMVSPGDGLKWGDFNRLVGKKVNKYIKKNTLISLEDVE
jgi:sialic acid synthase